MKSEAATKPGVSRPVVPFSWKGFGRGAKLAIPVVLGYFPVGFAFGVLAAGAGLTGSEAGLMSLLVYAGSAQLIAVDMFQVGITAASIILTTFVVNLRHMLMSAALSPYFNGFPKSWLAAFSFEMTDETFALHMSRLGTGSIDWGEIMGINVTSHGAWLSASLLGAFLGDIITDVKVYGLDYALAGMFIALLLPHCRIPRRLAAAVLAAVLAVLFTMNGLADWSAILATGLSAAIIVAIPGARREGRKETAHE